MAVKYHNPSCPQNCGRRWVDWGAEKLGYKCPECGEALVPISMGESPSGAKKPTLKRKKKKAAAPPPPTLSTFEDDDSTTAPALDEIGGTSVDVDDADVEDIDTDDDDAIVDGVDIDLDDDDEVEDEKEDEIV